MGVDGGVENVSLSSESAEPADNVERDARSACSITVPQGQDRSGAAYRLASQATYEEGNGCVGMLEMYMHGTGLLIKRF